ncbi:hypothetical protein VCRA2126O85_20028 [Vibrio crassostreae]|nr:hypothetical protein VCRA2127O91_20031 [Vibrio crassostreae]CAK2822201.1 hypothetical protein VCRA2126O86_20028 [Vibrio crassostreae]CAK2826599.1 hypothetical protein VCRA2126O85_20028 [Vibrio crassostreae]CAK2828370.1 hypothetical protein VCRA2125O83_20031 [Vibrio crassostreae]CAK2916623.1 hypothetical protein VCRA2128O106_30004 [Vibrio crassostreae]
MLTLLSSMAEKAFVPARVFAPSWENRMSTYQPPFMQGSNNGNKQSITKAKDRNRTESPGLWT